MVKAATMKYLVLYHDGEEFFKGALVESKSLKDLQAETSMNIAVLAGGNIEATILRPSLVLGAVRFVGAIANLLKNGERDEEKEKFELTCDDAVDTLHRLIGDARELLEEKP